ncbi:hypothetical protein RHMOL_Rhmol04G0222000 [Rhododendron molle]|uniref:Uncharacterized protein n=1 Tax=Rhododendron molle TaxID=49168 RepID=A0ACC0P300_RHOML|nr:hypothetical protein RHMOL_Rhmol04G0222000 [Rhododendron molle]
MIRAAQYNHNIILKISARNQKKISGKVSSGQFFIEQFNKKLLKSRAFRSFFLVDF